MKVVLFCGGQGTRMRRHGDDVPKPLVRLGRRPLIWHVMRYYAHFGHRDFILCLGHKPDDFRAFAAKLAAAPRGSAEAEWRVTCVDTGVSTNIGGRLRAVAPLLREEDMFLANYSDGLSDVPLDKLIAEAKGRGAIATMVAVRPNHTFHVIAQGADGAVQGLHDTRSAGLWINGGFFVLRREIFDFLQPGEELVHEPFQRLIDRRALLAVRHFGFWQGVDTRRELNDLEQRRARGDAPWEVWNNPEGPEIRRQPAKAAEPALRGSAQLQLV